MSALSKTYGRSLALLTDLYQLTMSCGYWKSGLSDREATFHLFFRRPPFGGQYAVACGLADVVEFLQNFRYTDDDLAYLAELRGNDERRLFDDGFLAELARIEFACDVDAVPEGTAVFAHEPLVRVTGPLMQCQLLETPLLNLVNFQTLAATKSSRICRAAGDDLVLEFGLRRAQGIDGGLTAARAAYVGGCAATSNVLAGRLHGIPVKGTHAHSWVMCFDRELEAFRAYADALPNNCIFLVDTYDTIEGVKNAVTVGRELRERGHEMAGVRLDSGDLAQLSIEARRILDVADMTDAKIVASNDLDEYTIRDLKAAGARIDVWGVGTKLATCYDQPALGGVYKLAAIRDESGVLQHRVKLSEDDVKTSHPGVQQIRRFSRDGFLSGDVIYNEADPRPDSWTAVSFDGGDAWTPDDGDDSTDVLVPVFRGGRLVYDVPDVHTARANCQRELDALPENVLALTDAVPYRVGLEQSLSELKNRLIARREQDGAQS